ncbi:hypothetical protein [Photobacterium kishitanii]|uniref:hypothetical protein n=2 Tax=Photobacterium kishitanii TaxID=318456 RepID=UPI0015E70A98|nr:hypothetical protein [Photobacterium kishitanii]
MERSWTVFFRDRSTLRTIVGIYHEGGHCIAIDVFYKNKKVLIWQEDQYGASANIHLHIAKIDGIDTDKKLELDFDLALKDAEIKAKPFYRSCELIPTFLLKMNTTTIEKWVKE